MKTTEKSNRFSLLLAGVSLAFAAGFGSAYGSEMHAPLRFADAAALGGTPLVQAGALETESGTAYDSIAVTKPADGSTVFNNSGNMEVTVVVSPALDSAAGDRVALSVDGRRTTVQIATDFKLTGIVRGEHTLEAQVVDSSGQTLISSKPVKFYMWQASRLFPNRRGK